MHSYLMESICKTGIFIICVQVLLHFRPKASYEKYLKMLVSAMILMQLFTPISGLFRGQEGQTLEERVAWFESELELRMEEAALGYEKQMSELEAEEENPDSESGTEDCGQIEPIEKIEITIDKGDEADADTKTGNNP